MLRVALALGLVIWIAAFAIRLLVTPVEACGDYEAPQLRAASALAAGWMQAALRDDGSYVYIYEADTDSQPNLYNEVRHAGVTMALYQHAGRTSDAEELAAADEALEWMIGRLHRQDGWAALTRNGGRQAQLGASALMLAGLAERRLATGDTQHDELMRELGAFIVTLQRDDGGFHVAWQIVEDGPDTEGTSPYYPGEALWALALLHEALPDERWEASARSAARFISTLRDEVEGIQRRPLNDHWAAYGFAEMAEWGLEEPEILYARRLVTRFSDLVRSEAEFERGGPGGLLHSGSPRRGASLGTWVEGLAALWRLSTADPRLADLRPQIEERVACAASILAGRQVRAEEAPTFATPELALGAWFHEGETRMDDQQHSLSGLLYAADALEGHTMREPESHIEPE